MEEDTLYTKGFNQGYSLAQFLPNLFLTLTKCIHSTGRFVEGFLLGGKEYEREQMQTQMNALRQIREQNKERENERVRGD